MQLLVSENWQLHRPLSGASATWRELSCSESCWFLAYKASTCAAECSAAPVNL